jgi:hypothetical protein
MDTPSKSGPFGIGGTMIRLRILIRSILAESYQSVSSERQE